ncbi:hypothetical protein ACRQ1B_11445 [Rhizobium panacihumi]|uniref:hypothetical protein n=1 Tax=Rhizobium panacihumi TaxID=2008450 RepID=UPI003D7AD877
MDRKAGNIERGPNVTGQSRFCRNRFAPLRYFHKEKPALRPACLMQKLYLKFAFLTALRQGFGKVRKRLFFAHAFLQRIDQNQRKRLPIRAILVDAVFGAGIIEDLLKKAELIGIDRLSNLCAHENLHRSRLPLPGVGYSAYVLYVCEALATFPRNKGTNWTYLRSAYRR